MKSFLSGAFVFVIQTEKNNKKKIKNFFSNKIPQFVITTKKLAISTPGSARLGRKRQEKFCHVTKELYQNISKQSFLF